MYFNEFDGRKFELLQKACADYLERNKSVRDVIEIKYFNEDFEVLFPVCKDEIKRYPSLVYLDQNGVKFLSDKYLLELEKMQKTDFLYFVSASYFRRFGNTKEFKENVNIDMEAAKKAPYEYIHREVIEQLKMRLPIGTPLKLYPYSLKKGTNIYGIIFGATHPRAVDKFLSIAWKRNEINGEANFDIDGDIHRNQLDLFAGRRLSKIESFKRQVREKILSKEITNNVELLEFVFEEGHIGIHAAECVREMKRAKEITFDGASPLVTYDNVYKNRKEVVYKLI